jgi:hypothetical protein
LVVRLTQSNVTLNALLVKPYAIIAAIAAVVAPIFALGGGGTVYGERVLARETGGRVIKTRKPEDLSSALEEVIGDLVARYNLGFTLDEKEPDDGRMHKLEVRVKARDSNGKGRKLEVFARRSYYLPRSQEQKQMDRAESEEHIRNNERRR